MSSNNLLSIHRGKNSGYEIVMQDADSNFKMGKPKKAKTLKEALGKAMVWMERESIEYGLRYVDLK